MTDATEESRERWRSVAAGWARRREVFAETAAGPGSVGFQVASLVGDEGSVLVTDFAPEMVAAARERAAELGLGNVRFEVADAQRTGLPDRSFDAVVCRFGYMLMPEPGRGLAETARVLRDGGRVAFAVWGDRRRNRWGTAAGRALAELGFVEPPDPLAPGPFALDDPARLAATVEGAGLDLVAVEEVEIVWRFDSVDEWWALSRDLSSTLREGLAGLAPEEVDAVRARAGELLEPEATEGEVRLPGLARTVLARPRAGRR